MGRKITVSFNGVSMERSLYFTEYDQLIQWIYKVFPDLRCYALDLRVNSVSLTNQSEYTSLIKSTKSLEIQIEKSKSKHSSNSFGIFKLREENGDLLCTGFLVSDSFAIIPLCIYESSKIQNLQLLFEDGSDVKLKYDGEVVRVGNFLIVAELEHKIVDFHPVTFELDQHLANITGKIWHYTIHRPVLHQRKVYFQRLFNEEEPLNLELEPGAVGSPIISSTKNLLGVVISSTSAIGFQTLLSTLKDKIIQQDSITHCEVTEVTNFPDTTCYLDTRSSKLVFYSPEEAVHKSTPFVRFIKGSSAVVAGQGIFVSGLGPDQMPRVWIYNGYFGKELPPTLNKHLYHSSLAIDNCVYAISGVTAAVEVYDFTCNSWTLLTPLPKRRAMTTAVNYQRKIYVIGGKRENKVSKSILKFRNNDWKKIGVKIPLGIYCAGCIIAGGNFIIFGGMNSEGKNLKSWAINDKEKSCEESNYSIDGGFGRFPVVYLESEVFMYSNVGALYKYDTVSQEIYMLSLDEETIIHDKN